MHQSFAKARNPILAQCLPPAVCRC